MQTPNPGGALLAGRARLASEYCPPGAPAAPPALLINLDRSADRLARMRLQFARTGVPFERFPAVNGTELPPGLRPYFCDGSGDIASPLRSGEIGCYASHLGVWQRIAEGRFARPTRVT